MNKADLIVIIILIILILIAIFTIARNKRNGKTNCGCDCFNCNYRCQNRINKSK